MLDVDDVFAFATALVFAAMFVAAGVAVMLYLLSGLAGPNLTGF